MTEPPHVHVLNLHHIPASFFQPFSYRTHHFVSVSRSMPPFQKVESAQVPFPPPHRPGSDSIILQSPDIYIPYSPSSVITMFSETSAIIQSCPHNTPYSRSSFTLCFPICRLRSGDTPFLTLRVYLMRRTHQPIGSSTGLRLTQG